VVRLDLAAVCALGAWGFPVALALTLFDSWLRNLWSAPALSGRRLR
jgi:hypothetical protein